MLVINLIAVELIQFLDHFERVRGSEQQSWYLLTQHLLGTVSRYIYHQELK